MGRPVKMARVKKKVSSPPLPNVVWIQTFFKNTRDGFVLVDENKQIRAMNPAMESIMGWSPAEVLGKMTCDVLFGCENNKRCPVASGGCASKDADKKTLTGHFHETSPLNKNGVRRKLWFSCSPLSASAEEPSSAIIIVRDITQRKRKEETLIALSVRDSLTDLYNHSFFISQLIKEIHRSQRYLHPVSLLMIDVDDFKKYNDTYGHYKGDQLLIRVAKILKGNVRSIDFVARYGGEEFAIILLETSREDAYRVAEKVRMEVKQRIPAGPTISIGVASCPENSRMAKGLIEKADRALYQAKRSGKNLVLLFPPG
jgi:diguanylate cyclase (GGDEF)-like protein/PAS domain S-box-containing protein